MKIDFGRLHISFAEPVAVETPVEGELAAAGQSYYARATEVWNTDDVIRAKGPTYVRNMEKKNGFLAGLLRTRRQAVVGRGWDVTPAGDDPDSVGVAGFVRQALERMEGDFSEDLRNVYTAMKWGYSITEKIWEPWESPDFGARWAYRGLHLKEWEKFIFVVDAFGNRVGLVQTEPRRLPLSYGKFVVAVYEPEPGNPYGRGTLPECYWHDWFMREGWNFWGVACERYGAPIVVVTHPRNASEAAKDELDTILENLQTRAGIRLPEGMTLDLKQAIATGRDSFGAFIAEQKENLQIKVLGETLTSTQGDRGSQSLGEVHERVRDELADEDTEWLFRIVNEQIVRPLVDVNYAGAAYPVVFPPVRDQIDLEAFARMVQSLSAVGFRIPAKWAYTRFGIPEPIGDEPVLERPAPQPFPFAEGGQARLPAPRTMVAGARFAEDEPDDAGSDDFGAFGRDFTAYEDAASLRGMHAAGAALIDAARAEAHGIWAEIRDGMIGAAEDALRERRLDVEISAPVEAMGRFRDLVYRANLAAHLDGQASVIGELSRRGLALFAEAPDPDLLAEPLPPEQAIEWFTKRRPDFTVSLAEEALGDVSGFVTRIEADKARTIIYERLHEAIRSGWGVREFRSAIIGDFRVWTGDLVGAAGSLAQADARIATIFRTNVMSALNGGRDEIFRVAEDPAQAADPIVAYQYSAVMDDRTRPDHAAMDGRIYGAKDPIWAIWNPPNGYNCRCVRVPILRSQAAAMGEGELSTEPPMIGGVVVMPDKGFGKLAA